ncbi:hypothetical protein VHA01S_030_00050 [Vibrio halioticoli NBRC 102217]|uniref:Uncharacterized protein n=1 Tax=Vibrio halioticoli NBRC 102217 TaxID=1219072 RepID=V5HL80_9VIBR|nr:hypothetical protein [Vibrio halioticoli]GAD89930.1 hypothetical protein VHA01S_030_00050 [Vibrio halioticoli NBRC 102217]
MKQLTKFEVNKISGGREAEGAYNTHGPDRTRAQAMRENNPGDTDKLRSDLRNTGLALTAIGAVVPGVPGRIVGAVGAGTALAGGWERNGGNH